MKGIPSKLILMIILVASVNAQAQQQRKEIKVQMKGESWQYDPGTIEFLDIDGHHAMKITDGRHMATLKGIDFTDGVIAFDIQLMPAGFTSVYFRQQSADERECFYFRTGKNRNDDAEDALQYAPIVGGINLWDIFPEYQSNASLKIGKWNHVKMIISGKQMRVYVNDTLHPALIVPHLEGNTTNGAIAFDGEPLIANLVIKPGATEDLSPLPQADITDNDPRYLRKWEVSQQVTYLKPGIDFSFNDMPDSTAAWEPVSAERKGLINLTRKFGGNQQRKAVWLKTNIHADADMIKKLRLGFSDEVWVFINRQLLYLDKNNFNTPTMKTPDGRISLDNTSFNLPLKKGDNELLICVENDFYGWGIIAHLDDNKGLSLKR